LNLYYFDTETFSNGNGVDPFKDELITVQYQKLDTNGRPLGELEIVRGWEIGEKGLVDVCRELFKPWEFVPVGVNLSFDFLLLRNKFRQYGYDWLPMAQLRWFQNKFPHIDLKHVLVLSNGCQFKGWNKILNKGGENANIKIYYDLKQYDKIEAYIRKEAENTIKIFQQALKITPMIKELKI
jgi:hypothetical protein